MIGRLPGGEIGQLNLSVIHSLNHSPSDRVSYLDSRLCTISITTVIVTYVDPWPETCPRILESCICIDGSDDHNEENSVGVFAGKRRSCGIEARRHETGGHEYQRIWNGSDKSFQSQRTSSSM